MENEGIYYYAKDPSQFTSVELLYKKIGGTFLTWQTLRSRIHFKKWPITWQNSHLFLKKRKLDKFKKEIEFLFPDCAYDTVRHFYLGPFPEDIKLLICMTMYPVPSREERAFPTLQFYHGVADKRFKVNKGKEYPALYDHWDYWMLSGEKDRQKLLNSAKTAGITLKEENLVKIGHLRFDKVINKKYDQNALKKLAGIPENGKKNIFFAPTWKWGGGTLLSHYEEFCLKIPIEYNLIIRPHTNDTKKLPVIKQFCREKKIENVYFIDNGMMNFVDNMLIVDMMISDPSSSVMTDFLITQKPMIMNKNTSSDALIRKKPFNVRRCGFEYDIEKDDIMDIIEKSFTTDQFKPHIKDVLTNSFYFLDGKATDRAEKFIQNLLY